MPVPDAVLSAELLREGEYWTIVFGEHELRVRDSKGVGYLAELLAHPDREIEVLALSTPISGEPASPAEIADAGLAYPSDSDAGPILDERARHAYRKRLQDLRGEIDEAKAFHDPERASRARDEYEAIVEQLSAATGIGGRDRRAGSPAERARLNVTRAIKSAIARVAEYDEALGEHLSACVHTGRVCVYRPDRATPVAWNVSTRAPRRRLLPRRFQPPDTQYAERGDISIAYQVIGEGPVDLILVNGLMAHMDLLWAEPRATAALRELASFSRLILFDKPGTGLSDPVVGAPSIEQRMDDIRAVMDAVGSKQAALIGYSEGGLASAMFAATYPQRVKALVLLATGAKTERAPDFLPDVEAVDRLLSAVTSAVDHWGAGELMLTYAPSWAKNEVHRRTAGIAERACASPGMARAMLASLRECDVRAILPTISAPTLVLHPRGDALVAVELGRDLAHRIPGARLVELPGDDHFFFAGDWQPFVSEIEEFVTRERHEAKPERLLQTVLVTDIAVPAERPAEVGDERWRELLARHEQVLHDQLVRFGGRPVSSLEDGFVAAFDGPSRAVRCACAILDQLLPSGLQLRAGIHSGECEAIGEDLSGLAVQIGARIGALARPSEVLVSRTVCDLVAGSGIEFTDRGTHELSQVPGHWRLYAVAGDQPTDARPISSTDDRGATLTPGPRDAMRPIDRAAVSLAKHAPSISRLGFRLGDIWRRAH